MAALDKGWIPRGSLTTNVEIVHACQREDNNEYFCVIKKDQLDSSVRVAVKYILDKTNATNSTADAVLNMTGTEFLNKANDIVTNYVAQYYATGATCDFGGIAMLVETNRTKRNSGSGKHNYFEDEYYAEYGRHGDGTTIKGWVLILCGVFLALLGGSIGFIFAMNCSPKFNQMVQKSPAFKPITGSDSDLVRASLNLPKKSHYEEIPSHAPHHNNDGTSRPQVNGNDHGI